MAACVGVVLVPAAAQGGSGHGNAKTFVPGTLRRAAAANPAGVFRVIIQGDTGYSTGEVAGDVQEEQGDHPGRAQGMKRRFRSLGAVSADLTGRQLLELAGREELLAITPDVAIKQAGGPTESLPPAVSGAAMVGQALYASTGTWIPVGTLALALQWQRCDAQETCVDVQGATGSTYDLGPGDVGATFRIAVTATDDTGSATAVSQPSAVVVAAPVSPVGPLPAPVATALPAVTGTAAAGQTLTATEGTWDVAPTDTLTYGVQWERCDPRGAGCAAVTGATALQYTVAAADIGSTLRVTVTAIGASGSSTAASLPTAVVSPPPPPAATTRPTIAGTAASGQTLTAANGTWDAGSLTFTIQWQRCDDTGDACADIADANGVTYTAHAAEIESTLRVAVTASGAGGSSTAVSLVTAVVTGPAGPTVFTAPSVRGTAAWRHTLSVNPGVWQTTGLEPYEYQWQRCDDTGAACVDIPLAIDSDYRVRAADVGATIRVVVTATDEGGTTTAPSSATPVVVAYASSQLWPYSLGADRLWPSAAATTVDTSAPAIAVVDSGVDAWAAGLGDRLVYRGIMTSLTPNSPGDGLGHGTFVAGIAAGAFVGFAGAAPSARIVSLDVMDDNGMAMTSDVIAAADWIVTHKDEYGIRVANLSLIGTTPTSLLYDPLDAAVERLWLAGVVVVTASGNYAVDSADSGVLYSPGNDPFVITVGASDINGTADAADDTAAPWSAYGHTPDGFAKPEIGAPGRYLVAGVPPRSTLALAMPERIVQPGFIQLSGTSFATAATSGVAAALLEQHPGWTPDQVKGALMAAARQTSAAPGQLGVGEIDAPAAAAVTDPANPNAALNTYVATDPATGARTFDSAAWRDAAMTDPVWSAVSWGVVSWGVVSWGVVSWGVNYWSTGAAAAERGDEVVSASAPADGAGTDFLPAGGYWVSPSGR